MGQSSSPPVTADAARIRRMFPWVTAALGVGIAIIVATFTLWLTGRIDAWPASVLFLIAASLLGGSGAYIVLNIPYIARLTPLVLIGSAILIGSQILNVLDDFEFMRRAPFIGPEGWMHLHRFDDLLLFGAISLLFACGYLALLDGALVRARLTREAAEKAAAHDEIRHYALALRSSEAKALGQLSELEQLYDHAPAGLCVVDADLHFIKVNQFFAVLAGKAIEEHLEKQPHEVLPQLGPRLEAICRDVIATGEAAQNVELVYAAGQERGQSHWLASFFPLRGGEGPPDGVQWVVQDITDLKTAQAEQRQLELQVQYAQKLESLGVMAGGIAHDFNNLLTVILGGAALARERARGDERLDRVLENVESAATRAAALVHQLLAYTGRGMREIRHVDLGRLMSACAPLVSASLAKKTRLHLDCSPECWVDGDAGQLQQVLMNLIINGSEALEDAPGEVHVRIGRRRYGARELAPFAQTAPVEPGEYVFAEVRDTGCGMPEETLARVFDPFFTTKFAGRGLGLAVVLGIVRQHGGALHVVSAPGAGSSVTAIFPLGRLEAPAETPPSGQAEDEDALRQWPGGNVLIIDDEPLVRDSAREILELRGAAVLEADCGASGLAAYDAHRDAIRLILLDVTMPDLDGEEVYAMLRARGANQPILFISGYHADSISIPDDGLPIGFLQKPFTPKELSRSVSRLLQPAHPG